MEFIPLIVIENQKIRGDTAYSKGKLRDINEGERIYILDLDGIEKDDPNLFLYQEMSSYYDTWMDCGPRNIGAVVDVFMEGASTITLRKNLCSKLDISDLREISENRIFVNIDLENQDFVGKEDPFLNDCDGFVNFNSKEKIQQDPALSRYFDEIKNKTYSYEPDAKNRMFWQQFGIQGLLVDLTTLKEFRDGL